MDFGNSEDSDSFRSLWIKLKYLRHCESDDCELSKSEILDKLIEMKKYQVSKELVLDMEDDEIKRNQLIQYITEQEMESILNELQLTENQDERCLVLNQFMSIAND